MLVGSPAFAPGEVGQAFSLNGTSQYVSVPDSASLRPTNVTLECWVNYATTTGVRSLVAKPVGSSVYNSYCIWYQNGQLNGGITTTTFTTPVLRKTWTPVLGTWHHIAYTFDSGAQTHALYLDGVAVAADTVSGSIGYDNQPLLIGADIANGVYSYFHGGLLDEVSIYNRALTAAEIQAIYNAGSAGKCKTVHGAAATATIVNGFMVEVAIANGGWGYTNTPGVRVVGGGGSGADAVAVVSNGMVTAIEVLDAGFGYTNAPLIVIEPPFIPQPTLSNAAESLLSFTNLAVGSNYQLQYLSDTNWSNAGSVFTAVSDTFTQFVLGAAGSNGYRLSTAPVPAQALATPQVVDGFVVGATVTSGGSGYASIPAVTIVPNGAGSNAMAIATVNNGVVTGITITDAGIGYTNPPTIVIDLPPVNALWPTVTPAMQISVGSLAPYDTYQTEFAPIIGGGWSNIGLPFTSTSTTATQDISISGDAGFFRAKYVK